MIKKIFKNLNNKIKTSATDEKEEKKIIQNELQNKSKYKNNNKCFSWIPPTPKKIQEAN